MGFHIRRYIYLSTCLIQTLAVVQKQVFDFLGFLWIPILVNFFEIIFIILGFFGGYQNRAKYIITYLIWQILWIIWNIFIICLYLDVGELDHKTNKVLKLDSNSESWWRTEGPQCKTRMSPESSPEVESPPEVENCLFNYIDVEVFQCSVQIILVVLGIFFGINLIRIISRGDSDSFSDKSSRKRNRTSLYSIEFSTDLDNRHEDYNQDFNHLAPAMSPKPMTPRKVKRRSVMTRGSSTRYSTTSKRHSGSRSSTRSSRRSLQNPITYLMEQQKTLSTFDRSQHLEPPVPTSLNMSNNNLGAYSHANLTYQQSSTQSLNKMDDLDELYTGRPASVRSSYSNFHGTREFNYTNVNPYQHSHATPQVPQKKQKLRNGSMFLNNGPPAYTQRIYSNDSETTM
ncbi:sodium/potassium-transporting ATPase subunit beta-1-interacting protein 2 [Coccinella septempunctata]|uniref:sodium/potassium-transporting ATPase subunit beta-1-interacting protein 2 n=1 Tax=Coccinella septempunctata TaxID=41139 RepID=UPI001D07117C|nr:sodium/potassium-transporting ATPase subunit beta-1-interacting protein 2 [Coccinella septempunctata]